jgi:hypothetical protein
MNVTNFIFQLLHIHNLSTLSILTPLHSPYTRFVDCAHLSDDYENASSHYTNLSPDYAHNFNDYVNSFNDRANNIIDSIDTPNISSLHLCKIKTMFTIMFVIYSLFSTFFICGFCISHPSSSSSMPEFPS